MAYIPLMTEVVTFSVSELPAEISPEIRGLPVSNVEPPFWLDDSGGVLKIDGNVNCFPIEVNVLLDATECFLETASTYIANRLRLMSCSTITVVGGIAIDMPSDYINIIKLKRHCGACGRLRAGCCSSPRVRRDGITSNVPDGRYYMTYYSKPDMEDPAYNTIIELLVKRANESGIISTTVSHGVESISRTRVYRDIDNLLEKEIEAIKQSNVLVGAISKGGRRRSCRCGGSRRGYARGYTFS